MKILLLSDTHYKGPLTDNRLTKLITEHDFVLHAGDIACDSALADFMATGKFHGVAGNSDPFDIRHRLGTKRLISLGNTMIGLCHGYSLTQSPLDHVKKLFGNSNRIVVFGHSHVPYIEETNDVMYINPGSVSMPRGGSSSSCAQILIDGKKITARHIKLS